MKKRPRPRTKAQRQETRAAWDRRRKRAQRDPRIIPFDRIPPLGTVLVAVQEGREDEAVRLLSRASIKVWPLGATDNYCGRRDHQGN